MNQTHHISHNKWIILTVRTKYTHAIQCTVQLEPNTHMQYSELYSSLYLVVELQSTHYSEQQSN